MRFLPLSRPLPISRIEAENLFAASMRICLLASLLITLGYAIWALGRGFDITDHSYYLLNAIYPDEIKLLVTAAHWFTSILWSVTRSLYGFQATGLAILFSSALVLAFGVIAAASKLGLNVKNRPSDIASILATSAVGALLYGSLVNFTPSYNLITTAAAYAATGLTLLSLTNLPIWRRIAFQLLAGSMIGIAFLCKFPAGIATLSLILVLITVIGHTAQERAIAIVLILIGAALLAVAMTAYQTTFSNAINEFQMGIAFSKLTQNESVSSRLMRYWQGFYEDVNWASTVFTVPLICFFIYAVSGFTSIAVVGIIFMIWALISDGHMLGGMSRFPSQTVPLLAVCMLSLLANISLSKINWKLCVLIGGLFALPYAIAVGTGNPLHTQILMSLAPWGALIGTLAFTEHAAGRSRSPSMLLCVIFVAIITVQLISSEKAPYRLNRPFAEQAVPLKVGAIGTVRLDWETRQFVTKIMDAAEKCNILPGRPFLGFYDIPGVALMVQGRPVFMPWLFNKTYAEAVISHIQPEVLSSAVIGIQLKPNGDMPSLPKQLEAFPTGYRKCGEGTFPYEKQRIQLWIKEVSRDK